MSTLPKSNRGLRLGLTGGMGCGKSTAAGIFRELGFGVLESDVIVHELWETDGEVQQAVFKRWGSKIMEDGKWKMENEDQEPASQKAHKKQPEASGEQPDSPAEQPVSCNLQPATPSSLIPHPSSLRISRRKVAEIVFADPAELDWLETLLHPRVRARWQAAVAADPGQDWVVEIPLLFEKSLASEFDYTLCIASSPTLQASRLAARGLAPAEVAARQARQWPLRDKIERADWVAFNDGSVDFLRRQIVHFASQLRAPAPATLLSPPTAAREH